MASQDTIVTLFEFTENGLSELTNKVQNLSTTLQQAKQQQEEVSQKQKSAAKELEALSKAYGDYQAKLNKNSNKEEREQFEAVKKSIADTNAEIVKLTNEQTKLNQTQERAAKQLKDSSDSANAYKKVLEGLSKGVDGTGTSIKKLSEAQSLLRKELQNAEVGSEKYKALSQELAAVSSTLNKMRADQQQATKQFGVSEKSVEALRQKVSSLKKEWVTLDQSSPDFARVKNDLKATTDELNKAEQAVGIYSRNVGNYGSALDSMGGALNKLIPGLGAVTAGIGGMTRAALKFIATPIGAIIAAIVLALETLHQAFTRSAEGQDKFNQLMSVLGGIMNTLLDVIANVGSYLISMFTEPREAFNKFKKYVLDPWLFQFKVIYNTAMGVGYAVAGIFSKEARQKSEGYFKNIKEDFNELKATAIEVYDKVAGIGKKIADNAREGNEIAKLEAKLRKETNAAMVETAANQDKINNLRKAAADKDKITTEERLKYLEQARKLIERNGQIEAGLAEQALEIQKRKNAMGLTNQADERKEAELEAKVIEARAKATNAQREIVAQMAEIRTSAATKEAAAQKALNDGYKKAYTERLKAYEEMVAAQNTLNELNFKQVSAAEKKASQAIYEAAQANYQSKLEAEKKASEQNLTIAQSERDALELLEIQTQQKIQKAREESQKQQIDSYNAALDEVRSYQAKLIEAQSSGDALSVELYRQILQHKREVLEEYDASMFEYTEEQKLEQEERENEYREQQIQTFLSFHQELNELTEQYNASNVEKEKQLLLTKINNQKAAIDGLKTELAGIGVSANEVLAQADAATVQIDNSIGQGLRNAADSFIEYANSTNTAMGKITASAAKQFKKVFDVSKEFKNGQASLDKLIAAAASATLSMASDAISTISSISNAAYEKEKQAIDERYSYEQSRLEDTNQKAISELDTRLNNYEISEARYAIEKIRLDNQKAQQEKDLEKRKANEIYNIEVKQFKTNQKQQLAQAAIGVAQGIIQAWALGPIVGAVMSATIAAVGAVQIAAIRKQEPPSKPKFEKGGMVDMGVITGNSHKNGGVPITVGDKQVAEAEGGEGALIISKKAMRNPEMIEALRNVEGINERISGKNKNAKKFAAGGYLDYDYFYNQAYNSMEVTFKDKKIWVREPGKSEWVRYDKWSGHGDAEAMHDAATDIATRNFEEYRNRELQKLEQREASTTSAQNQRIASNSDLRNMGITNVQSYNTTLNSKNERYQQVNSQLTAMKELNDIRQQELKDRLKYDEKMEGFDQKRAEADEELAEKTKRLNFDVLRDLRKSGAITVEEYNSYFDQILFGYGATTQDIIELKKKEVAAIKEQIEKERELELEAAETAASWQQTALDQIREEWQANYEETTQKIIDDFSESNEAVKELTGSDLELFNQAVSIGKEVEKITTEIAALNDEYNQNDAKLNDQVIESRAEQEALLKEQLRIKEEIARKEKEAEEARTRQEEAQAKFQEQREAGMADALKNFESENFDEILARVRELGAALQFDDENTLTLDKQLALDLQNTLSGINEEYDAQIAAQDEISNKLNKQYEDLELIHQKKIHDANSEQEAFENMFNAQSKLITDAYEKSTRDLNRQAQELRAQIATIQLAGMDVGMDAYEKAIQAIQEAANNLPTHATGGIVNIGTGVYDVTGNSHANGGVKVSVGNRPVAEVEAGEKLLAINKLAAADPEMNAALSYISDINKRYSGVGFMPDNVTATSGIQIDYDLLAAKLGQQINSRPVQTYIKESDIAFALKLKQMKNNSFYMK